MIDPEFLPEPPLLKLDLLIHDYVSGRVFTFLTHP